MIRVASNKSNALVEIVAEYRRDRFRSKDGFVIAICDGDDECEKYKDKNGKLTVKVNDPNEELKEEIAYRFFGKWLEDAKWGWQFVANTFVESAPASRRGILAYLETAPGIGTTTARELFEKYGSNAIQELRDNPEKVYSEVSVRGFTLDKAKEAADNLKKRTAKEAIILDLMDLLDGRGFPKTIYDKLINKHGNRAAAVVRVNPHALWLERGVGFDTADKLYMDLGKNPAKLRRQSACALSALFEDRIGHTWHPVEKIAQAINEKIGGAKARPAVALRAAIRAGLLVEKTTCPRCDGKGVSGYVGEMEYLFGDFTAGMIQKTCHECRGKGGRKWVAIKDYAESEKRVAEMMADAVWGRQPKGVGWPQLSLDSGCSQHQLDAIRLATQSRFGILTGSPGTGKSYTIARFIAECIKVAGSRGVAICALAGKAAGRMSQLLNEYSVKLKGTTIHKLLGARPKPGEEDEFELSESKVNPKFVFIDEFSMPDVPLTRAFLNAMPNDTYVMFVGDINQLPPIGHGAPMRDFITAGVPLGRLTEIRRNSGNAVLACAAMREGKPFWQYVTDQPNFNAECPQNLIFRTADRNQIITRTLETIGEFQSWDFDPVWDCQVIVALNETGASRHVLNQKLQAMLNPNGATIDRWKLKENFEFRTGDKVIHLQNCWLKSSKDHYAADAKEFGDDDEFKDNRKADEVEISNGDLGRVIGFDSKERMIVRYEYPIRYALYPAPRKGKSNDSENGGDEKKRIIDLGYAITCNKMQGSQAKAVALVLDDSPAASGSIGICKREWFETGVSRMQKVCALIGKKETAERMVARQALPERKTFLAELIGSEKSKFTAGGAA